jgi:hypothetical protein
LGGDVKRLFADRSASAKREYAQFISNQRRIHSPLITLGASRAFRPIVSRG